MSLIQELMQRTGITQEQATGAAGAVFKFAKEKLSGAEYSQLADALPDNVDGLAAQASNGNGGASGWKGAVSAAASSLGILACGFGKIAGLVCMVCQLGFDSSKVTQIVETVKSYAEQHGGPAIRNLLAKATG